MILSVVAGSNFELSSIGQNYVIKVPVASQGNDEQRISLEKVSPPDR